VVPCPVAELLLQEQLAIDSSDVYRHGYNMSPFAAAPFRGRRHSTETKQAISRTGKGRKLSAETRQAISKALTGRKFSSAHRRAMSAVRISKKLTEAQCAAISSAKKGKPTPEGTENLRKSNLDRTPEYNKWLGRKAIATRWGHKFDEPKPQRFASNVLSCPALV
jgi:hypothetical protein